MSKTPGLSGRVNPINMSNTLTKILAKGKSKIPDCEGGGTARDRLKFTRLVGLSRYSMIAKADGVERGSEKLPLSRLCLISISTDNKSQRET
jgi:hypothetical protein